MIDGPVAARPILREPRRSSVASLATAQDWTETGMGSFASSIAVAGSEAERRTNRNECCRASAGRRAGLRWSRDVNRPAERGDPRSADISPPPVRTAESES